jgi:hypothetical protein
MAIDNEPSHRASWVLAADLMYLERNGALTGVAEIIRERRRQIEQKHYTPGHDRTAHADGGLAEMVQVEAAGCVGARLDGLADPHTDQTAMAMTGAMAAAEIDRLAGEFDPEPAAYRCWRSDNYTHHVHGPGQPCPVYGDQP